MISLAAYAAAVLIGLWAGFQYTLFAVPVFQITWTLFCVIRMIQLLHGGSHKADAPQYDRDSYGFALGGLISSAALFLVLVGITQVV
ncbi:MAG TPA: hypothetical protein VN428_21370 [Bryobacteraceae bacterium]|nr:hypothetical protein [Bryobacteraceae bacterium]